MSVEPEVFKRVMRCWASSVAIVTTRVGDAVHGLTVSGFVGISLEPALVAVSIGHNQFSHGRIRAGQVYAVNMLRVDQADLSDRFAGRRPNVVDRFRGVEWHAAATGAPILDDCLGWFDCRVVAEHEVGDHTLFIGEVLAGQVAGSGQPLVYFGGDYRPVEEQETATPAEL